MTIVDNKVSPAAGVAKKLLSRFFVSAVSQTKTILDILQIPYSFCVESVNAYCSALTSTCTADCRLVPVLPTGSVIDAVVLTIGGTATDWKLNSAVRALLPQIVAPAVVPGLVYKGVTDNNAFSSDFTINTAAAAGLFWGAARVQMDATGALSTKVVSPDQAFATEAQALVSCPLPDAGKIDLGTITIQMKTGDAFTANTTALNDTSVNAAHFNGRATSAFSVLTGEVSFVATESAQGTVVSQIPNRAVGSPGGLLLIDYTTGSGSAVTNGVVDVGYRPYPMAGEVLVPGIPQAT
jgi:hypothetical protein